MPYLSVNRTQHHSIGRIPDKVGPRRTCTEAPTHSYLLETHAFLRFHFHVSDYRRIVQSYFCSGVDSRWVASTALVPFDSRTFPIRHRETRNSSTALWTSILQRHERHCIAANNSRPLAFGHRYHRLAKISNRVDLGVCSSSERWCTVHRWVAFVHKASRRRFLNYGTIRRIKDEYVQLFLFVHCRQQVSPFFSRYCGDANSRLKYCNVWYFFLSFEQRYRMACTCSVVRLR